MSKEEGNSKGVPVIVTAAEYGRAVIFGWVEQFPTDLSQPVILRGARMILYWSKACGGIFGLAANGPKEGTRITAPVDELFEPDWKRAWTVSSRAAEEIESWSTQ